MYCFIWSSRVLKMKFYGTLKSVTKVTAVGVVVINQKYKITSSKQIPT